jgi:hypothetical protein
LPIYRNNWGRSRTVRSSQFAVHGSQFEVDRWRWKQLGFMMSYAFPKRCLDETVNREP